jgi:hypothetical protein
VSRFQKATRKQLKLRMAICGPTGAGKTRSALRIAAALGTRIAVIDTENRSASVYVGKPDVPEFDVLELSQLAPRNYVDAIGEAEREGFEVIIVDSLSHAWQSKDGALAMADRAEKRTGNKFTAWGDVTPEHDALVDKLLRCSAHLIVTMRSKMAYVLEENARGKQAPRKVGMAPIQRNGMEYEFHVTAEMDVDHNMFVSKSRFDSVDQATVNRPGREFGETLLAELAQGLPAPVEADPPLAQPSGAASSTPSETGSRARPTSTPRSTGASRSSASSSDRELPTDAEGWRAAHNALCDQLFQEHGIESGCADEHGLHVPTLPVPSFSAQAKKHASERYDAVKPGYLREVFWRKPAFWGDASSPQKLHVSYLVTRHELAKLEQAAAEQALGQGGAA